MRRAPALIKLRALNGGDWTVVTGASPAAGGYPDHFTQMDEIFPSVIVSTSTVRICTSAPFGWMVPKGVSYGSVCRPRMMNATARLLASSTTCTTSAPNSENAACRDRALGDKINERQI